MPYESRETFLWTKDLDPNTIYFLTYMVKTMNGLECSSPRYRISQARSIGTEVQDLEKQNLNQMGQSFLQDCQTFLITKACSKNDYQWTEFKRFDVQSLIPSEWSLIDCTLEQGYFYKYSL